MFKFKFDSDEKLFQSEMNHISKDKVTDVDVARFKKNRLMLVESIRRFNTGYVYALEKFKIDTKNKRFQPSLAKFIASYKGGPLSLHEHHHLLKALTSYRTHLLIEFEYFHSVYEHVELVNLFYAFENIYQTINNAVFNKCPLSSTVLASLASFVHVDFLFAVLSECLGLSFDEIATERFNILKFLETRIN